MAMAAPLRIKMGQNGLPVDDYEKDRLVDKRIRNCDINLIPEGKARGREIRWCRETKETFAQADDEGT